MTRLSARNPFVGPRPIQQGETLHGRSAEIRELYNRLQARRIVVLHSPSGAGKSSLVQAGLIPRLKKGGFDVWKPIRVNLDPAGLGIPEGTNRYLLSAMVSLEEELPPERRRSPAELASLDLLEYLRTRPRRKSKAKTKRSIVLLFDQFEEVLTVEPRAVEAKRELFSAVGRALDTTEYWALFIIREDYLAAFAPYRDRIPTQMTNTFRLDLLGLSGAREALVNLAEEGGRRFPGVDRLVRDLSTVQVQQPDGSFVAEQGLHVEPVHLQVVGRRLWESMPDDATSIDEEDITRHASVSEALGGYYADSVAELADGDVPTERAIRDWVGNKLIMGGVRSQVRREADTTAGLPNELIDGLLDCYLVRKEQRAGADWFELGHDRMVDPVQSDNRHWDEAHLHPLQVQAKLWERGNRSPTLLLNMEGLMPATLWARANAAVLTPAEKEFIQESHLHRSAEVKRQWWSRVLLTTAVIVALVMAGLGLKAYEQRTKANEKTALAERKEAQAWAEHARAEQEAERAHTASLMSGARELLVREQRAAAAMLLAEIEQPLEVHGWGQVALDTLGGAIQTSTLVHQRHVEAAAWSPDSARVATAASSTLRIWPADGAGEVITTDDARGSKLRSLAWSPDGARIVVGTESGHAQLYDADGSAVDPPIEAHVGPVTQVAWSADGTRIMTASEDNVRVWRADTTASIRALTTDEPLLRATMSSDGARVLIVRPVGDPWLVDVDDDADPIPLSGHAGPVRWGAWSPDGTRMVTASDDRTVRVWTRDGEAAEPVLEGHEGPVYRVEWSPDGARLASLSADGTTRVWAVDDPLASAHMESGGQDIGAVRWSPDGTHIATASGDWVLRVWAPDAPDGQDTPRVFRAHRGAVTDVAWSPDGARLMTLCNDKAVRIWSMQPVPEPVVLRGHQGPVRTVEWSPDDRSVLTASDDGTARIWSPDDGPAQRSLAGHTEPLRMATWSPDGTRVATASEDHTARIFYADGQGESIELRGHEGPVVSVQWSPDGSELLTASEDGTARMWSTDGDVHTTALRGHEGPVHSARWDRDGARIVTASEDGTARIFYADDPERVLVLRGHEGPVYWAAWSPDGTRLVTVSEDATARVWASEGGQLDVLAGHEDPVHFAAWSPNGMRIATVSDDQTARVWPADGGDEPLVLRGHEGAVTFVAWRPDGRRIITASADRSARIWPVDGRRDPLLLAGRDHAVVHVDFSADGRRVAMAVGNTGRRWTVHIPDLHAAVLRSTNDCLSPRMRRMYLTEHEVEAHTRWRACEQAHGRAASLAGVVLEHRPWEVLWDRVSTMTRTVQPTTHRVP